MNAKRILPIAALVVIIAVAAMATLAPSERESGMAAPDESTTFATQHIKGIIPPGWELVSAFTTAGEGALRFEGPNNSLSIVYYVAVDNENTSENYIDELSGAMVELLDNSQGITVQDVADFSVTRATARKIEVSANGTTRILYLWLRSDIGEGMLFNVIAETPDSGQLAAIDALVTGLEYALLEG